MTKTNKIIVALLSLFAFAAIQIFVIDSSNLVDTDLADFFSGILLGAGGTILLSALFRKNNKFDITE